MSFFLKEGDAGLKNIGIKVGSIIKILDRVEKDKVSAIIGFNTKIYY